MAVCFKGTVDLQFDLDEAVLIEHQAYFRGSRILDVEIEEVKHRLGDGCARVPLLSAHVTLSIAVALPVMNLLKPCLISS